MKLYIKFSEIVAYFIYNFNIYKCLIGILFSPTSSKETLKKSQNFSDSFASYWIPLHFKQKLNVKIISKVPIEKS